MFNKKEKPIIKFVSVIDNVYNIKELHPKPANKFLPQWWNDMPQKGISDIITAKRCPGIADYLRIGYILPMWADLHMSVEDSRLKYTYDTREYKFADTLGRYLPFGMHSKPQMMDHVDLEMIDRKITDIINIASPWRIITPPGYSTLVLPLLYEFNKNFTVMPGIFDTDIFHGTNIPIMVHSNNEPFSIKMKEPLLMYIPFKRTKNKLKVFNKISEEYKIIKDKEFDIEYNRKDSPAIYRRMQQERDNDF